MLSPRDVFDRMKQQWAGQGGGIPDDLLAEDVVIETPFSPPGSRRIEGRARWCSFAEASRAALPVRLEKCRELAVHETTDPEVIVVEYELSGTIIATGRKAAATFIGVLRVRDGRIVLWREYQDVLALAEAFGRAPEQLSGVPG